MEEHFQVGPHFLQMFFTRKFENTYQHTEHPAGHSRDIGHILIHRLAGYTVALYLEVAQQGCLLLGHSHQVGQRIDILDEDGTQVAHQTARDIIVGRMTSAKNKALSIEELAFGMISQIIGHRIEASCIMNAMQSVA